MAEGKEVMEEMDQRTGLHEMGCHGGLPEEGTSVLRTRTMRAAMGRPGASSRQREQHMQRPWGGTELKKRKRLRRGRGDWRTPHDPADPRKEVGPPRCSA